MTDHVANRAIVVAALKAEIVGPDSIGEEIDVVEGAVYDDRPYRQRSTTEDMECGTFGQEILRGEPPHLRYGAGVLYPLGVLGEQVLESPVSDEVSQPTSGEGDAEPEFEESRTRKGGRTEADDEPFTLEAANRFQPSSVGVSLLVEIASGDRIIVDASGGRYSAWTATVRGKAKPAKDAGGDEPSNGAAPESGVFKQQWWLRHPVTLRAVFSARDVLDAAAFVPPQEGPDAVNAGGIELAVQLFARSVPGIPHPLRLITVALINRTSGKFEPEKCLFQTHLRVQIVGADGQVKPAIAPYPRPDMENGDEEEQSLAMLYRDNETFAIGHGCAAGWDRSPKDRRATYVDAECFPTYEAPSVTPDLTASDGERLRISMNSLAVLDGPDHPAFRELGRIIAEYRHWIERTEIKSKEIAGEFPVAAKHISACRRSAERMEDGLEFLRTSARAREAFRLANHAMYLQGVRSRIKRPLQRQDKKVTFGEYPAVPDINTAGDRYWRPFQIAFLLMSLRSSVEPSTEDREVVDLIWFPTGGGKTEAYLGLAAFSMFFRRFQDPQDAGTQVLMRYTLRLLTQQQLQRASSLICAMEFLRRGAKGRLGETRFTIGIWAGGDVTPNKRDGALKLYRQLLRDGKTAEGNLLILPRCPWCGAEMGVQKRGEGKQVGGNYIVYGATETRRTVKYVCPDAQCLYSASDMGGETLPVEFIDEDIYQSPPTLVVGTVDKFATMHHSPGARALFGYADDGAAARRFTPPGLIIQDELHLISGPLGSMVGLYEGLIERLCTPDGNPRPAGPKIVCSTATIRRYQRQAQNLFGRPDVSLFPPPGIDAGDSFFARYAYREDGSLDQGRLYVGVHPTGYTSGQTARVRTFSALLQAPVDLAQQCDPDTPCGREAECPYKSGPATCAVQTTRRACREAQDPWWTLLIFFNSLRDLGNAIALFQSDIPDFRQTVLRRRAISPLRLRMEYRPKELTSRLQNHEVPLALSALEVKRTDNNQSAVGVCLASNIIEVGIDVDRMSLMCVVAQPKTTSTYIQVTGRVGRNWSVAPGLVVAIYAADRARDRSHFERFRSYHERLYAQVEPTSVTPYSMPALERALHGVYSAYVRLLGTEEQATRPAPFPQGEIKSFIDFLRARALRCGFSEEEEAAIRRAANRRLPRWKNGPPQKWNALHSDEDALLMMPTGDPLKQEDPSQLPWATPMSMRNVDASCELEFSERYYREDEEIV